MQKLPDMTLSLAAAGDEGLEPSSHTTSQRIGPAQPRKTAEIAVVGMHHRLGFDGKGSNVGIREQGATQNTGFAEA